MEALGSRPTALVLPGGAAYGSWQAGCLYGLAHVRKLNFHSIFGTSVGAINGTAYVQDTFERLREVWTTVKGSDFFRLSPRLNPVSFFSQKHLRSYLSSIVDEKRARELKRCWFYIISTDIANGKTHQAVYSPEPDGAWEGQLVEHLLGSISIPFVLPPVHVSRNGRGHHLLLDGVAKSYVNLLPALARGVKDILFLNVVHPAQLSNPGFGFTSYISTLINQLIQGQIDHSLESVRLAGAGEIRAYMFHPSRPLTMKALKFDTAECRQAFELGLEEAEGLLSNPEAYRVL